MESTSEVVTNSVADKSVCVEGSAKNTEAEQQSVAAEVTATIKVHAAEDKKSKVVEETVAEKKEVEQTKKSSAADQKEVEEVVEEVVVEDCDESEDGVNETVTEKVINTTDGNQTKTITVTTVEKVTPAGTKSVVTTTSVTKEAPTATTTIITTLTTPTTEEIKTLTTDVEKVESNENEEEEEEAEEEEEEEEVTENEEDEGAEEEEDNKKIVKATDLKKSKELPQQQQLHKDQIVQEAESQPKEATPVKEETVVDAPSIAPQSHEQENNKQDNLNNTLKDIISSIDSNIKAEENIAALKERELELLKKQQELSREIEQQKLLAQKLASENQTQQQINNNFTYQQQSNIIPKTYKPITNVSKYSTFEEKQDENVYSRKTETFETTESTNVSKKIDLDKIFKPATDSEEILPKNRKLYASSAFYSPSLHPTVEDQVELARRISHSLSDISNQQSRGQSMYVNRKKRSVKWVHEGCGQEEDENITITNQNEYQQEEKENNVSHHEKVPLKFLMNPSGQMRDINSIRESINTETGLLSPDVSAEVMTALQAQKGRGAELFAKRRKVSEKWVVDESNVGAQSPSGLPDYHQYQQQPRPSTSPSILPAYTDAAKHRVQLNLHQEQLLEKYAKPGLKVVQTPWEAALNSGSASAAFVEEQKLSPYPTSTLTPSPTPQLYDASQGGAPLQSAPTETGSYSKSFYTPDCPKYQAYTAPAPQAQHEPQLYSGNNLQRELAYKPSIPQGWKTASMSLPKEQQSNIETTVSANEMKRVQQQQITSVIEATKSCEEFNSRDEIELIDLFRDNAQEEYTNYTTNISTQVSNHMLSTKEHQFVNHLIKSPELRVSPLPLSTQVIYDNAVQELQMKQLHIQQQESNMPAGTCDNHNEDVNEKEEKVSVRKQLEQYEDLQRQFSKQRQQDEFLKKKREAAKLKTLQYNSKNTASNVHSNTTNISAKSSLQQIAPQQQHNDDDYIKVPVKELITNFEQQCLQDEELNTPSAAASHNLKDNVNLVSELQMETNKLTERYNEDLYMPKEIPLQSYAPPPVAAFPSSVSPLSSNLGYETSHNSTYKPLSSSPLAQYSMSESQPVTNKAYGSGNTFPISKPNQPGFASSYGSNQPPRQQYLPPQSYQTKTENTSQNIPQVNFNPSPLPYDKLAKFENQPADEGRYNSPPLRNYNLNVRGANKVRNVSPAPFGGFYNRPCTASSDTHYYGGTPSPASPRPLSSIQQYSGHNTPNLTHPSVTSTQILNAPSYNTSARGWGCSGGTAGYQQHPRLHLSASKPQIVNAASMPYTDF